MLTNDLLLDYMYTKKYPYGEKNPIINNNNPLFSDKIIKENIQKEDLIYSKHSIILNKILLNNNKFSFGIARKNNKYSMVFFNKFHINNKDSSSMKIKFSRKHLYTKHKLKQNVGDNLYLEVK